MGSEAKKAPTGDSWIPLFLAHESLPRSVHQWEGAGVMTTHWRPDLKKLRAEAEAEAKLLGDVDAAEQGVKRKRAPKTKGPCERGVKWRSQCKVCSACPHGRWRRQCKECGGSSICEHGRIRTTCKECGGASICEHGRQRSACKECSGSQICEHSRQRQKCKECSGSSICEHGRIRYECKECGGSQICEHGRQRSQCKECHGSSVPIGRWAVDT